MISLLKSRERINNIANIQFQGSKKPAGKTVSFRGNDTPDVVDIKKVKKATQVLNDMQAIIAEDQKRETPVLAKFGPETVKKIVGFFLREGSKPVAVGVSGGSASGKTTIKEKFVAEIEKTAPPSDDGMPSVQAISHDMFYKDFSVEAKAAKAKGEDILLTKNLDHPDAVETSLLVKKLKELKDGKEVKIPEFQINGTGIRIDEKIPVKPAPLLLVEGLFTLADENLKKLLDLKVFVDASKEVRAKRWWDRAIKRDMKRDAAGQAMFDRAFSMHDLFVEPSKKDADIIINSEAKFSDIDSVVQKLARVLTQPVSFAGLFKSKKAA